MLIGRLCFANLTGAAFTLAILHMRFYNPGVPINESSGRSMSQPFKLHRLQQIDTQLDQVRSRLKEIEAALADHSSIRRAREQFAQTKATLDAASKQLQHAEEAVKAQRMKIDQTESTLYGGKVRNPKELQDLQNESTALRRYLSVLEDRQLEAMISLEETEVDYKISAELLETTQLETENRNKALLSEQAYLRQEELRLENERKAAASALEEGDLELYQQLRIIRQGVAVARVVDNTCSACGSTLSAAQLHAARSLNQIIRCNSCSRILYGGA